MQQTAARHTGPGLDLQCRRTVVSLGDEAVHGSIKDAFTAIGCALCPPRSVGGDFRHGWQNTAGQFKQSILTVYLAPCSTACADLLSSGARVCVYAASASWAAFVASRKIELILRRAARHLAVTKAFSFLCFFLCFATDDIHDATPG